MPFEKGNTYGKGRIKGSSNKLNNKIRGSFEMLLNENMEQIKKDLADMDPVERCKILLGITRFILPVASTVEMTGDSILKPVYITVSKDSQKDLENSIDKNGEYDLTKISDKTLDEILAQEAKDEEL